MKRFRKERKFSSYQQMCEALEIVPAPRGTKREKQKQQIAESYKIEIHANNSITLTPLSKQQKEAIAYDEAVKNGYIIDIDDAVFDVRLRDAYTYTGIDRLVLDRIQSSIEGVSSKQGLVTKCFARSKVYKELLWKRGTLAEDTYSKEAVVSAGNLILARLTAVVNSSLNRLEKQQRIKIRQYYVTKEGSEYEVEDVRPIIKKALEQCQFRSEYVAFQNEENAKRFIAVRNELFYDEFREHLKKKIFDVQPDEPVYNSEGERATAMAERANETLSNQDIQEILVKFFMVFRKRVCSGIDRDCRTLRHKRSKTKDKICAHSKEVKDIINTYCAYMTTPRDVGDTQTFYTLDELLAYRGTFEESELTNADCYEAIAEVNGKICDYEPDLDWVDD